MYRVITKSDHGYLPKLNMSIEKSGPCRPVVIGGEDPQGSGRKLITPKYELEQIYFQRFMKVEKKIKPLPFPPTFNYWLSPMGLYYEEQGVRGPR